MKGYWQKRDELNRLYSAPKHRRLKYAAIAVIAVSIVMQITMTVWHDEICEPMRLIMQGCVGLGAIAFVILVAVFVYKVNLDHFSSGRNTPKED